MTFWIHNIRRVNGQPFLRAHINRVLDIDLDTDAGGSGWGAVMAVPPDAVLSESTLLAAVANSLLPTITISSVSSALSTGIRLCGTFTGAEMKEGSNVRKLLATKYALHVLGPTLANLRMDHRVDNSGVVQGLGGLIPATPDRFWRVEN